MKIITWNVNGIRAAEKKGEINNLLTSQNPDVLMMQEIKGNKEQFSSFLTENTDYLQYYSSAEKKGYAGTSLWIGKTLKKNISDIQFNNTIPASPNTNEGRLCQVSFEYQDQWWDILSIYFPNGGKSNQAWLEKLEFYDRVHDYINNLRKQKRLVIVGGDMNVAHNEIDIARPKANDGKIGFHPKERAWMDRLIANNWIDVWRNRNPDTIDVYSWWHAISKGRERNVGWRIDYFLMDSANLDRVAEVEYLNEQMGSDHCPLTMTLKK